MVISSSHTALAEKVYHTAPEKQEKSAVTADFSLFLIVNGKNAS